MRALLAIGQLMIKISLFDSELSFHNLVELKIVC